MSFTIYDASAPVFIKTLRNMRNWLDKAGAEKSEAGLFEARLAEDMHPLPRQFQFVSDSSKFAVARLTGTEAPAMEDTETSFAELQARIDKTIAFIESVDASAYAGAETREVLVKFPNGMGYRFTGADYLRDFALPNFYFHATTAYAILRANGVSLGKPDYLAHLGMPEQL
ncbi:MAG: DUF1993 domain-containing protein [Candidatus Andeanibacterium colombiense]|uniref:DUF1993 domain-containing protein n=1 Tax=Candidatus Andeanibacterium colombiense TaxID=3121345 RepID=A0AAJ5X6Q3_9SPHN|nr:MAG: DUF1993 domain-containing protein [Sphingomonadaceae bacterium]